MKQSTSSRTHKTYILVALALMVLIVAKTVTAGTKYAITSLQQNKSSGQGIEESILKKVVAEIEDLPWQPLASFFK